MMVMEYIEDLIPISYIRQYLFFPRIPWYKYVMGLEPPAQAWVSQGKRWHEDQAPKNKRRIHHELGITKTHYVEAYVKSAKLGIHGFIDELIIGENKSIIIEYKIDTGKPTRAQKLQLIAYAIAAEETYEIEVIKCILLKGSAKKQYSIIKTQELKIDLLNTLAQLRKVLENQRLPHSSASSAKCDQCEYLRYCNDR